MLSKVTGIVVLLALTVSVSLPAQTIYEYTAKRTPSPLIIDGVLNESAWEAVPFTEGFVQYRYGTSPKYATRCKLLWDNTHLYIAFVMNDVDVWAKTVVWSDPSYCLCSEEVAEIFIDPDGDGLNYLESEINPHGAVMDLLMSKEWSKGGSGDYDWTMQNMGIGITVQGTLNNQASADTSWTCEFALPFSEIAFSAPTMHFPPLNGDAWRLNLYRYNYDRDANGNTPSNLQELTAWNQTDSRGFHAPDKFARVIFSTEVAGGATPVADAAALPSAVTITGNFPNPFNPDTSIEFTVPRSGAVRLEMFNITGQKVRTLVSASLKPGKYTARWDGKLESGASAPSGIYFARISQGANTATRRMLLLK